MIVGEYNFLGFILQFKKVLEKFGLLKIFRTTSTMAVNIDMILNTEENSDEDLEDVNYAELLEGEVKHYDVTANKYICDFPACPLVSSTADAFRIHRREHAGEKMYKCSEENCKSR